MSSSKPSNLHWNPAITRHGLGTNLTHVHSSRFFVSNLQKSVDFYSNIMKFKLLKMEKGSYAIFDAKNMLLELKVGNPTAFSAENLIVGHVSVDVPDSKQAFEYLTQMKVPFEINVSVPKGVGKAESEGGGADNTLGQAFIRDPDGYYLEICNCHLLTDFVLGDKGGSYYGEDVKTANASFRGVISLLKMKGKRSRQKIFERRNSSSSVASEVDPLPPSDQPEQADPTILDNFIKRRAVYGDICQSFTPEQLNEILRQAGNKASTAILLMQARIELGDVTRVYKPPAYYVGKVDETSKYQPVNLVAGGEEKGKFMNAPSDMTVGYKYAVDKIRGAYNSSMEEENKEPDTPEVSFAISSVNHIAFIVSDVGKSATFYSDVLGLQQVKRPNFDRHGAWFTGGNIEIHLILGNPLAPDRSTKGLEANTTWFVVEDIDKAIAKLKELSDKYGDIQLEISDNEESEEKFATCRDLDGYVFGFFSPMTSVSSKMKHI